MGGAGAVYAQGRTAAGGDHRVRAAVPRGRRDFAARLALLQEQRQVLLDRKRTIDETLKRLDVKIRRYEEAVRTGRLCWDENGCGE